jgi:hypothetical protein
MDSPSIMKQAERPYISTGHLPETVQERASETQRRFRSNADGKNSQSLSGACQNPERGGPSAKAAQPDPELI